MKMIIYQPKSVGMFEFVEFWSQRYQYDNESLYDDNIGNQLTDVRVRELFLWKNGTPLSEKKQKSVEINYIDRLDELAIIPQSASSNDFLNIFRDGGAIWRIFWLHCWQPDRFPIYDQHVHRAMTYLQGEPEEIPSYDPRKIDAYIAQYIPFHEEFSTLDNRKVDQALWAYGKFVKENNFPR